MTGRTMYEVRRYNEYSYEHLRLFTERDQAELFVERWHEIYGSGYGEISIHELVAEPVAPEAEVWHTAFAHRTPTGVSYTERTGRLVYWSDEVAKGVPTEPHARVDGAAPPRATGYGRTPSEARKQVAKIAQQWDAQAAREMEEQRAQAMKNFLNLAGPMINGGL